MSAMGGWFAFTPWVLPVLASAAFISGLSVYLWKRRDMPGALPLSLSGFLIALLCLVVAANLHDRSAHPGRMVHGRRRARPPGGHPRAGVRA